MKKLKQRGLATIFEHYPYKKRHKPSITRPTITGWEFNSDHELSLSWSEWKILTHIYLKLLGEFLMSGMVVKLPAKMGMFKFYKYKYPESRQVLDFQHYHNTGEWTTLSYNNNHTNNYGPIITWNRNKGQADFRRKWFWMLRLSRPYKKKLSKAIMHNSSLLFSYDDVPRN
jgi:hypothetical protein